MDEGRLGNLGKVEKLLEDRGKGETEARIKLLLAKIHSVVGLLVRGERLAIY